MSDCFFNSSTTGPGLLSVCQTCSGSLYLLKVNISQVNRRQLLWQPAFKSQPPPPCPEGSHVGGPLLPQVVHTESILFQARSLKQVEGLLVWSDPIRRGEQGITFHSELKMSGCCGRSPLSTEAYGQGWINLLRGVKVPRAKKKAVGPC